ncbi:MAG: hypothetical protein KAZ08_00635, partial [Aquaspirillum sp.]|nr:hypothetical protein [Aquaspirillum sp.]
GALQPILSFHTELPMRRMINRIFRLYGRQDKISKPFLCMAQNIKNQTLKLIFDGFLTVNEKRFFVKRTFFSIKTTRKADKRTK